MYNSYHALWRHLNLCLWLRPFSVTRSKSCLSLLPMYPMVFDLRNPL